MKCRGNTFLPWYGGLQDLFSYTSLHVVLKNPLKFWFLVLHVKELGCCHSLITTVKNTEQGVPADRGKDRAANTAGTVAE